MKSFFSRRRLTIEDREVHVSLEHPFWSSLEEIAHTKATTTSTLVASIEANRTGINLPSAIRVYVLNHFQKQIRDLDDVDVPGSASQRLSNGDETDPDRPVWLN